MLSFEGDTGPYLQYAHVRLSSIERKNPELLPLPAPAQLKTELLVEPQAREIAFLLGSYPDAVKTALKTHEPSGIVTFAFRLAHAISSAWETVIVKGEQDGDEARARAWRYASSRGTCSARGAQAAQHQTARAHVDVPLKRGGILDFERRRHRADV